MTPASCWIALGSYLGYRATALVEDVWSAWRACDDDPAHLDEDEEMAL